MTSKTVTYRLYPWVVGTWNPYTWSSPWPYTVSKVRRIVTTYKVVRRG